MLQALIVIMRTRTILLVGFVGLIFVVVSLIDIVEGGRVSDILPSCGIGSLLLACATWLTRRALVTEGRVGRADIDERIRANRVRMRRGATIGSRVAERIGPAARTCGRCAATGEPDAVFCNKCGTEMS